MSTYELINKPLRKEVEKHPLALITYYLYSGLKKLRGLNFDKGLRDKEGRVKQDAKEA